jgi:hypothetical protein
MTCRAFNRTPGVSRASPDAWTHLRYLAAGVEQRRAGGAMNGAVHAAPAEHPLVRGVDDRIDVEGRDVSEDDFDRHSALRELRAHRVLRGYTLSMGIRGSVSAGLNPNTAP